MEMVSGGTEDEVVSTGTIIRHDTTQADPDMLAAMNADFQQSLVNDLNRSFQGILDTAEGRANQNIETTTTTTTTTSTTTTQPGTCTTSNYNNSLWSGNNSGNVGNGQVDHSVTTCTPSTSTTETTTVSTTTTQ